MYAQKAGLAIDGKAMYFGGAGRASDLGLRPSDVGRQTPDFRTLAADFMIEADKAT